MSKKFLLIYRSQASAEQSAPSPAEMGEVLKAWGKWKEAFPAILDMGDGLLPTGKRLKGGTVIDGPAVESKEIVSGYSIVGAASYDEALVVAKACPINRVPGNSVEVRELAGY
jgi:hypothetical protein